MAHQRKLIRDVLIALLVSANTAAASRVTSTRVDPNKKGALPAISVYTLNEQVDHDRSDRTAPHELTRDLSAEIVGTVAGATDDAVQDAMDALAEQIEAAVEANYYLDVAYDVTAIDPVTDQLTIIGHRLGTVAGPAAVVSTGTAPAGLSTSMQYSVIAVDADHVKLAASHGDALNGAAIDIADVGTGTLKLVVSMAVDVLLDSTVMEIAAGDGRSSPLVGFVALTYTVTYRTQPAELTDLGDFTTVDAKYLLVGGVPDTQHAEDTITVQET